MTMLMRERTCVCPGCSTEWLQHHDGTWENDNGFFGRRRFFDAYSGDPVPPGQKFCPVCAEETADVVDRVSFIKAECLEEDFLSWLIRDALREDIKAIFSTLLTHDPELMETRLQEYVFDKQEDRFVDWRCGV